MRTPYAANFAPKYLHPDGIARRMRWAENDHGQPDWNKVISRIAASTGIEREPMMAALHDMAAPMAEIAAQGENFSLERGISILEDQRANPGRTARPTALRPMMDKRLKPIPLHEQLTQRRETIATLVAHPEWDFPTVVRTLRTGIRMTVPEMAKATGLSARTIMDIEAGRSKGTMNSAEKILGMLGLRLAVVRQSAK